jgi:hypothetical protein
MGALTDAPNRLAKTYAAMDNRIVLNTSSCPMGSRSGSDRKRKVNQQKIPEGE